MSKDYISLQDLLDDDREANQFFYDLPDYIQEHISSRSDSVNSFESLQDYAENLLRGDD